MLYNVYILYISFCFTLFLLGELRDAVKNGNYMAVKLALNSKEDYNLDQEVCSVPFQTLIFSTF